MKIGVIFYSRTGNTLSVARKLKEKLAAAGHDASLAEIETAGAVSMSATSAELKTRPPVEPYDAVVFASPVQGGMPAAATRSYLEQLPSLAGKQVTLLVTGFFPAGWGRNQTIAQMSEICAAKDATICGAASVGWFSLRRGHQIAQAIDHLVESLE